MKPASEILFELQQAAAETEAFSLTAAGRIAEREPLWQIETELLEALESEIRAELQDRDRRSNDQQHLMTYTNPEEPF